MTEKKLYVVLNCVIITPWILDAPFAGFLVYFESELLKRAHKNFDFRNGRKLLPCCSSGILPIASSCHIPLFLDH